MFKFTIRDLLWLTVVVAIGMGWFHYASRSEKKVMSQPSPLSHAERHGVREIWRLGGTVYFDCPRDASLAKREFHPLETWPTCASSFPVGVAFGFRDFSGLPGSSRIVIRLPRSRSAQDAAVLPLAQLPTLRFVELSGNQISDSNLQVLRELPRLEALFLDSTMVSDRSIDVLSELSTLRFLDVRRSRMTAEGVARLRTALPLCKVQWINPRLD